MKSFDLDIGEPYLVQIAKDHKWENTWDIDLSSDLPNADKFIEYTKGSYDNVAIEILFKNSEGMKNILGFVFSDKLKIKTEAEFLEIITRIASNKSGFEDLVGELNKTLLHKDEFLFKGMPDMIRVGVVNHWFSVGPCLIWEKDSSTVIPKEELLDKLQQNQGLFKSRLNYQGISFIFNRNEFDFYYWIKPSCFKKKGEYFVVDINKIIKLMQNMFRFEFSS